MFYTSTKYLRTNHLSPINKGVKHLNVQTSLLSLIKGREICPV
jgi:hypothetical protein